MSRETHERWLRQLTELPTISGHEGAVVSWVTQWVKRRKDITLAKDRSGNLYLAQKRPLRKRPIWLTAHMDHPGFLAIEVDGNDVRWDFRGGVRKPYFTDAVIEWFDGGEPIGRSRIGRVKTTADGISGTSKRLRGSVAPAPGAIGRWYFPASRLGVSRGRLRAHGCDDLAGVAAALAVLDQARSRDELGDVGVILTRAEEVGFIGAIAAAKGGRIPKQSRLICLEMSRELPDARIGQGPVIRVGDATSVFSPELTNALAGLARQRKEDHGALFQRKLMTGGSCEATAFLAYGHAATCVCLPLGNYHNMGALDAVETKRAPAAVAPEEISLADWHGMVDLLVSSLGRLDAGESQIRDKLDSHFEASRSVL